MSRSRKGTPGMPLADSARRRVSSPNLFDLVGLVIGYGMAAVLVRAFWPRQGFSSAQALFALVFYGWLGMAMSGPIILSQRRGGRPEGGADRRRRGSPLGSLLARGPEATPPRESGSEAVERGMRSWAEMAWVVIGLYWIVVGVFAMPVRMQSFRPSDAVLFGVMPILPGLVFWLVGGGGEAEGEGSPRWTHRAAIWLLWTWPFAWVCLIILGMAVL
jgi:hypothetical protein